MKSHQYYSKRFSVLAILSWIILDAWIFGMAMISGITDRVIIDVDSNCEYDNGGRYICVSNSGYDYHRMYIQFFSVLTTFVGVMLALLVCSYYGADEQDSEKNSESEKNQNQSSELNSDSMV